MYLPAHGMYFLSRTSTLNQVLRIYNKTSPYNLAREKLHPGVSST
jgi:hypothetical protein